MLRRQILFSLAAAAQAAPQWRTFAIPTVLPDGHLADTPEVAAAKAAHYAEYARVLNSNYPFDNSFQRVFTPTFVPPFSSDSVPAVTPSFKYQSLSNPDVGVYVNPDGTLPDSAEVSKAKAIHYAALAQAVGAPVEPYLRYLATNFS